MVGQWVDDSDEGVVGRNGRILVKHDLVKVREARAAVVLKLQIGRQLVQRAPRIGWRLALYSNEPCACVRRYKASIGEDAICALAVRGNGPLYRGQCVISSAADIRKAA